jgi:hypothetical protein
MYRFSKLFQSLVDLKSRENYLYCSLPNRNFRPSQVEGVAWAGHWAGSALLAAATETINEIFKFPAKWILEISRQNRGKIWVREVCGLGAVKMLFFTGSSIQWLLQEINFELWSQRQSKDDKDVQYSKPRKNNNNANNGIPT